MKELDLHISQQPQIAPSAFVAPTADIMGAVTIGEHSSVWYQCVLRGDINAIRIGRESNIQDGTVIHVSSTEAAIVGNRVSCGHRAIIHACRIHDEVLIGMGAIIMDGAEVGEGSMIGAGALVTRGTQIPEGVLVMGTPARVVRDLSPAERESIPALAAKYRVVSSAHVQLLRGQQTS
ncbi:MAG: carbonic anhydrase/acetyltransferase-like protein (isoleucine patch superfamily) [Verrucomicrobiales bacterium]|jgi:carbonic anhydrase/acetyltransferase-like protein (isoleucine patch superfamily)